MPSTRAKDEWEKFVAEYFEVWRWQWVLGQEFSQFQGVVGSDRNMHQKNIIKHDPQGST